MPLRHSIKLEPALSAHYRAMLMCWLLLASLAMFFLASLVAYVIIRSGEVNLAPGSQVPLSFYYSTALLVVISMLLHASVIMVRHERQRTLNKLLLWATGLSLAFLAIQSWGLTTLWQKHFAFVDTSTRFYGVNFALAFIHAAHVLFGVGMLVFIVVRSRQQRYDHEFYWPISVTALYWHFLDVVWIAMLLTFVICNK